MNLTIAELARAVGKSETYVRQHVYRKHLTTRRDGRNVSVALSEAVRWARERGLSLDVPARAAVKTGGVKDRTARMTVLVWDAPGAQPRNLFTLIRHRRRDELGPWVGDPDESWSAHDLGHELRLFSFDGSFERCRALVDRVLDSGTLETGGLDVRYTLEPFPRRHWAYRDDRPFADASMRSPFSKHSAEVDEYWSFTAEPRQRWLDVLGALEGRGPAGLSGLGFPLERRPDRIGNLMIAGAEDAITCDLTWHRDQTLRFRVVADEPLLGTYRATIWASHSRDEVLRREIPVVAGHTAIEVPSDVDHIGFAVYRKGDGQCVDLQEGLLLKEIDLQIELQSSPTQLLLDGRRRLIHEVKPPGIISTSTVNADGGKAELDNGIRRQWLHRQVHERETAARREGNLWRFQPHEFNQAVERFVDLLRQDADREEPIYLADPYFMTCQEGDEGARLYLDTFAATTGRPLLVLCGENPEKLKNDGTQPWWSKYPNHLTKHVRVRSFLKRRAPKPKPWFHDRYLITPRREIVITHSLNGWLKSGVTFVCIPYSVYRAEAEELWSLGTGSTTEGRLIWEIT